MATAGHGTNLNLPDVASAPALLEAWRRFVALIEDPDTRPLIGTAETVDALLARSALQRAVDAGQPLDLVVLAATDAQFRAIAPTLLETTRIELYGHDQPVTDWWWRIPEIAQKGAGDQFADVAKAARLKGVHAHTVRAAIHAGELAARRLGRTFLIHERDLRVWQPRPVGRPATRRTLSEDTLLDSFNDANIRGDLERAHKVAKSIAAAPHSARRCIALSIDAFNQGDARTALRWADAANTYGVDRRGRAVLAITSSLAHLELNEPSNALAALADLSVPVELRTRYIASRVEVLMALQDLAAAQVLARQSAEEFPNAPELRYLAARVDFHAGAPVHALRHVALYRQAAPKAGAGLMLHGQILGQLGDLLRDRSLYSEALALFRAALPTEGWRATTKIGLTAARLGRWRIPIRLAGRLQREAHSEAADELIRIALGSAQASGKPKALRRAVALAEQVAGRSPWTALHEAYLLGTAGDWMAASRRIDETPHDRRSDPVELSALRSTALVAARREPEALELIENLPLAGTPFAVIPDLLRLRMAIERNDDDACHEILHRLADEQGPLGLLATVWIESNANRAQRQAQVSGTVLEMLSSPAPEVGSSPFEPWDANHLVVSKPVASFATSVA